jgi:predicted DNA-binding transcriptional regulator AlpA
MKRELPTKSKSDLPTTLPVDILWGADQIGEYIGRSRSETYYLIRKGAIPAKKLGPKTIVARKTEIDKALASFTEAE